MEDANQGQDKFVEHCLTFFGLCPQIISVDEPPEVFEIFLIDCPFLDSWNCTSNGLTCLVDADILICSGLGGERVPPLADIGIDRQFRKDCFGP